MVVVCPADERYQRDVAALYAVLMGTPFEEWGDTDKTFALGLLRHSKECPYHQRAWHDAFVDYMEQGMTAQQRRDGDIGPHEFTLLRRNVDVIFGRYL